MNKRIKNKQLKKAIEKYGIVIPKGFNGKIKSISYSKSGTLKIDYAIAVKQSIDCINVKVDMEDIKTVSKRKLLFDDIRFPTTGRYKSE